VVTLILVLSPLGSAVKGAQRWIQLGPVRFQPSEIAKLAVILGLALLLSAAARPMRWDRVARAVLIVAVPAGLIFLQPDLGTMLTFGFIAGVTIFVAGATWRQMAALIVAGLVATVGVFQAGVIKTYQITRLTAFLDETSDVLNTQYNQYQSQIAIGTGGLFGKGLFNGTQTNLRFVPEQSSDFIFTAVGEQLGFVGSLFVIAMFGIIIWRVLVSAANARDRFSQLASTGVAALVAFHVFVNIGMTIRVMPVTGLPLPFMSSGGTVFVVMSVALGMAHSVWMRRSPLVGERTSVDS
jgi:rod shape determining protein RodA